MSYFFKIDLGIYSSVPDKVYNPLFTLFLVEIERLRHVFNVDLLMNAAVSLGDELSCAFHKILLDGTKEEIVSQHFLALLQLLLCSIKVEMHEQSFNELGDGITVFVGLLLNDLDELLHLSLSALAGNDGSCEIAQNPGA